MKLSCGWDSHLRKVQRKLINAVSRFPLKCTTFFVDIYLGAGCGGVIIGESGEISYKEDGKYTNMEKCVWLVEAPQASKIRFRLERSGFEECCDLLIIHTIDRNSGIPYQAAAIS